MLVQRKLNNWSSSLVHFHNIFYQLQQIVVAFNSVLVNISVINADSVKAILLRGYDNLT